MKYMFGYGSIMNQTSLGKTLADPSQAIKATLQGYKRKCNAPYNGYLYMNIIPQTDSAIEGVLVPVSDDELEQMKAREVGYEAVDVTAAISPTQTQSVVAFVAPDKTFDMTYQIPRSYLSTCTRDMTEADRAQWITDTIIENEIIEDLDDPVYVNAAL